MAVYVNGDNYFNVFISLMENQPQINMDNENATFYTLCFSDYEAILGISETGVNTLVWNKNNLVYRVSGTIDLKTLIKIAENIKM